MARSSLETAKYLIKRRKFEMAMRFLENCEEEYEGIADFYVTYGIAYLYSDIAGKASEMFRKAREFSVTNINMLLGQAVVFMRRGEINRAVQYYLEVLENDPDNSTAKKALDFIRVDGEYETIVKMVETGEIKKFYPPLGFNPNVIRNVVVAGLCLGILCSVFVVFKPESRKVPVEKNTIEQKFYLSEDELLNAVQLNAQEGEFSVTMTTKEIQMAFSDAKKYFVASRDNACQLELNRIVNSNASIHIKQRAQAVMDLLQEPTFDSLKDNYSYSQVASNPGNYMDCYAIWDGMVTNSVFYEDGSWKCDLLVDYIPSENKNFQVGLCHVVFDKAPEPSVDETKPVRFLGKITQKGNDIVLSGRGVYQQLKGTTLK
ncbi:hypothetical protein [Treponema sp.]|uniref:tetratricopeptide repeat protein n=1 Tax=Treponema sp. TaxID=166 RepID=UPI00298EC1AE|nr:hypothetical protein [Treponema sp.]MCQ2240473.1 hypothetical protein [Treponema sp.]